MAIRSEDLSTCDPAPLGRVYRLPTSEVRARAARRRRAQIRRRRTALAAVSLSIIGLSVLGGGRSTAPAAPVGTPQTVVVQAGDTLWGLAERYAPDGTDPRAYVDLIVQQNELEGTLVAGTRLQLPR